MRNICNAAAVTGTGNLAVRAMSWMIPRSLMKMSTAERGVYIRHRAHDRHTIFKHPRIASGGGDDLVNLMNIETLLGRKYDGFARRSDLLASI